MRMLKSVIGIAALTAMVTAATAQSWITNGLVAYYPLNGNANDASGNGNNGTNQNAILCPDRFGRTNAAFYFNGTNSQVVAADSAALRSMVSSYSFNVWANFSSLPNRDQMMLCKSVGPATQRKWIFMKHTFWPQNTPMGIGTHITRPPTALWACYDHPIETNHWYMLTFSTTGTEFFVAIDGQVYLTQSGNYTLPDTTGVSLIIGGSETSGNYFFNGALSGVRIYNRALSTNEVAELYASEAAPPGPRPALATPVLANGFVIGVNLIDGGYGYTNTPKVQIIGGGGSGAQAVAVVTNGVVVAVNILSAGYGYTNTPNVAIAPPFIFRPILGSAPMTLLSFSDLAVGGSYQMQRQQAWYWTNQGASFTASSSTRTQMVAGAAGTANYRLVLTPAPSQAFATPQMVNGFLVGATVTGGGSGYVSVPAVTIVGGGGHNATAVASLSGGVVTGITITSAGIGYTNTPTVRIAAPPAASLSPEQLPVVRLDAASLAPYENYQVQYKPAVDAAWANWADGLFSPTAATNSQHLYTSNSAGFFRLRYLP